MGVGREGACLGTARRNSRSADVLFRERKAILQQKDGRPDGSVSFGARKSGPGVVRSRVRRTPRVCAVPVAGAVRPTARRCKKASGERADQEFARHVARIESGSGGPRRILADSRADRHRNGQRRRRGGRSSAALCGSPPQPEGSAISSADSQPSARSLRFTRGFPAGSGRGPERANGGRSARRSVARRRRVGGLSRRRAVATALAQGIGRETHFCRPPPSCTTATPGGLSLKR